jgi:phosphoribosylanthranilate isomerase
VPNPPAAQPASRKGGVGAWPRITVTGVDERTPIDEMIRLVETYPCVEVGILYTETPEGRNRYMRRRCITEWAQTFRKRCAIHVCGRSARANLFLGDAPGVYGVGRIQINGELTADQIRIACDRHTKAEIITQWKGPASCAGVARPNHAVLVDASGGRGLSPAEWVRPETTRPVGFAGGLGPDNLASELPRIAAVARDP